jgi:hypothetical protein
MAENIQQTLTSVGTSAVLIAPGRITGAPRQELIIINTSTGGQNITLTFGQGAAGYGIVLTPYAVYSANNGANYFVPQDEIWAIASAAGGQVSATVR